MRTITLERFMALPDERLIPIITGEFEFKRGEVEYDEDNFDTQQVYSFLLPQLTWVHDLHWRGMTEFDRGDYDNEFTKEMIAEKLKQDFKKYLLSK